MKSNKDIRGRNDGFAAEDLLRKATKLEPIKKSGKEKRAFYSEIEGDEDEDIDLKSLKKRESILDYFDDGDENDEDLEDDQDEDDDEDIDEDGDEEYEDIEDMDDEEWYDDEEEHKH